MNEFHERTSWITCNVFLQNIALLSGSEDGITAGVPDAPAASGSDADAAAALRELMREVRIQI